MLRRKKQANDWSAGILACIRAQSASKKVSITFNLEGNQDFQFVLRTRTLRLVCYTLRHAGMRALQSFSCTFPTHLLSTIKKAGTSKVQSSKLNFLIGLILLVVMLGCNKPQQNIPSDAIGLVNNRRLSLKTYEWKLKSGCEALGDCKEDSTDFEELRESIVSNLIDSALITEETERRGLKITNEKIQDVEKKEREKIGSETDYENFLKKYGLTRDEYKEILKSSIAEETLREDLTKDFQPTEKEIEDYYKEHGNEMNPPDESGKKLTLEQAKPEIVHILRTGGAKQWLSDWLKDARKKATVKLNDAYRFGKLKSEFPN
jgi:hypothetical protein